ncbi:putative pentatricopeptide repeat-containing protein, mitochondrial-like isoform X1 [Capsicum annuum]|nr:putative pentatricopeptide repeat-containing protein, mitochondrial-like isoform X1 [Capsicum annuum]
MSTSIDDLHHFHPSLVHLHQPPMSSFPTENRLSLWREIIESTRNIFKSHVGHFQAISILFLLPIVFSLIVYPSFHLAIFHPDYDFTSFARPHFSNIEIILLIVYTLFLSLFFICGVGTTTYSAVQAFYDRPINLVSSIKSIRNSFFPLLSTLIVSQTIFISITLIFSLILVFVVRILQSLGLKHGLNDHLSFVVIFGLIVLVPVLIWLQVNWSLAYVIAVVESKKGYETPRRSANLVKGKRWIAFGILMYYGLVIALMVVGCSMFLVSVDAAKGDQWRSLAVILQTVLGSVFGYVLMNQYLVVNMVLCMCCKELNNDEKLALETGGEYVYLPLDEEKKNHAIV